jgi:CYTH domain-containing protein
MIDDFVNTKDPLLLAEVEFNTKEEAAEFIPPLWFGKEVTYDENFKNKNLWKKLNRDLTFNK